jgi:hypothetical protein
VGKKPLMATIIILALLFSAVAGTQLVNLGRANPYSQSVYSGEIIPPESTTPPLIQILRPVNNETYTENSVVLSLNVTVGRAPLNPSAGKYFKNMYLETVYYKVDWQESNICVYNQTFYSREAVMFHYFFDSESNIHSEGTSGSYLHELELEGIPEGTHTITVNATERGHYYQGLFENSTFVTSDVALNFTVNQSVSEIICCVDGNENVTINGNITLTGLSNGGHNVTVYATDEAGNTGFSEIIYFSVDVPEPFPTTLVLASVITVAVVGVALLVYFKKRRAKSGG